MITWQSRPIKLSSKMLEELLIIEPEQLCVLFLFWHVVRFNPAFVLTLQKLEKMHPCYGLTRLHIRREHFFRLGDRYLKLMTVWVEIPQEHLCIKSLRLVKKQHIYIYVWSSGMEWIVNSRTLWQPVISSLQFLLSVLSLLLRYGNIS